MVALAPARLASIEFFAAPAFDRVVAATAMLVDPFGGTADHRSWCTSLVTAWPTSASALAVERRARRVEQAARRNAASNETRQPGRSAAIPPHRRRTGRDFLVTLNFPRRIAMPHSAQGT
jgi:hypothetical protein